MHSDPFISLLTSSRLPPAWLVSEWLRGGRRGNSEKLVLTCRRARLQSLDSRKAQRLWKSNPQPGGGRGRGWSSGYTWLCCNDRTKETRRFTVTFESLSNEPPQHLPTVVAEGGSAVGVDHQGMRTDPDLGHRCWTFVTVKRLKVVLLFCSICDSMNPILLRHFTFQCDSGIQVLQTTWDYPGKGCCTSAVQPKMFWVCGLVVLTSLKS